MAVVFLAFTHSAWAIPIEQSTSIPKVVSVRETPESSNEFSFEFVIAAGSGHRRVLGIPEAWGIDELLGYSVSGEVLAVVGREHDGCVIHRIDALTGTLLGSVPASIIDPVISADGTRIAYVRRLRRFLAWDTSDVVMTMNLRSGEEVPVFPSDNRLSRNPMIPVPDLAFRSFLVGNIIWLPDDQSIAFPVHIGLGEASELVVVRTGMEDEWIADQEIARFLLKCESETMGRTIAIAWDDSTEGIRIGDHNGRHSRVIAKGEIENSLRRYGDVKRICERPGAQHLAMLGLTGGIGEATRLVTAADNDRLQLTEGCHYHLSSSESETLMASVRISDLQSSDQASSALQFYLKHLGLSVESSNAGTSKSITVFSLAGDNRCERRAIQCESRLVLVSVCSLDRSFPKEECIDLAENVWVGFLGECEL